MKLLTRILFAALGLPVLGISGVLPLLAEATPLPQVDSTGKVTLNAVHSDAIRKPQMLPLKLETAIGPTLQPQSQVMARLAAPVHTGQQQLPSHARLMGRVHQNHPGGRRFGRHARLNIQWERWCPQSDTCLTIPESVSAQSVYPAKITKTTRSALAHYLPLQVLSTGVAIPLGISSPWTGMLVENAVGAVAGASYEVVKPEDPEQGKIKQFFSGALNSTSLPTLYRFVKKSPPLPMALPDTLVWLPMAPGLLQWMYASTGQQVLPGTTD